MAQESQLAHRVLTNLALPYQTNVSPTMTDGHYISGSTDILTSINGYAERRPGFANNLESSFTTFNNLQRLFAWDRFDGTFIVMACNINASGFAVVYKMVLGVDSSFVSIFTEPNPTGNVFDFVTSNNTVYFSNGIYVRKWDPVNGLSNWGISQYNANTTNSAYAGTGATVAGPSAIPWSNPTNAQGAPDGLYASAGPITHLTQTDFLKLTNYGLAVAANGTVQGITVNVTAHDTITSGATGTLNCQLLQNGSPVGNVKSLSVNTSDTILSFGSASDLWGGTWSPTTVNNATFGAYLWGTTTHITGTTTFFVDAAQIVVSSSGPPNVTFTGTGLTASVGYQYVICYGNSNTGHIGSPSPPSNLVKPANQGMSIPLVASTDPQVNQIRVFRTTDSASGLGGQAYFEIPNSPNTNTTTSISDNAPDSNLNALSIAPTPTFNDPPSSVPNGGLKGLRYFSGRIWGFTGNQVWFTGLEEITIGVPEECIPSGIAGNFWSFDEPVQALEVAGIGTNQGMAVFCGGRMYAIQGNSLDTFVRFQISNRRGARNRTCVSALGGMMAWLDSANQVWATDGSNLNELSTLIRNDLIGINQANCSLTFHTAGRFHWLVLSTGTKLYVYDVDTDQWMPPWTYAATYIYSGETSPGNYVLMASTGTEATQLNTTGLSFQDTHNGILTNYAPVLKFGLLSVVPDYGSRFSYIGVGSYNEPTRTGYPSTFQVTNNGNPISDFLICQDDDPTVAAYTSIAASATSPEIAFNRTNGSNMTQIVYQTLKPAARWIGMQINLPSANQYDKIYEVFMAYKGLGGR